ncbi:MAG: PAS domain S-box protein, partial [bacterium]
MKKLNLDEKIKKLEAKILALEDENSLLASQAKQTNQPPEFEDIGMALQESEEKFRAIFDAAQDGIAVMNMDGVFTEVNPTWCQMHGYTREEFLTMSPFEIIHPDTHHQYEELVATIKEGKPFLTQGHGVRKNGEVFDAEVHGTALFHSGKEHVLVIVRDITEPKKAESALRESEERYRRMADNAPDIIYRFTLVPRPGFEFISPAVDDITGYAPKDFYNDPELGLRIIHPEDRPKLDDFFAGILPERPHTARWQCKDGKIVWIEDRYSPIYDQDGNLTAVEGVARDITEQIRMEKALRESEQRFKQLSEASFEGIAIHDKGHILEANQTMVEMFGYKMEEFLGQNVMKFSAPESREFIRKNIREGSQKPYETIGIRKDGSRFPVEIIGKPIQYQGKTVRVNAIRDITVRKQAELALQESENKFRVLAETTAAAIFIFQGDKICYVNHASEVITGYAAAELEQMKFWEIIHPQYRDLIVKRGHARQKGSKVPNRYESKIISKSGDERWIDFTGCIIEFEGKPAVLWTAIDITERKNAEEALRESEAKYRHLIQHSGDAIYLLYNRRFEVINDKFQKMFCVTPQAVNKPDFDFMELVAPKSRPVVEERLKRQARGEQLEPKYEFTALSTEGKEIEVEASVSYINYKDGIATQGILRDITERKLLEAQLRQAQKMEAVGRLAGGVAHDFNNMLTVILGYSDMLLYQDFPDEMRADVEQIKTAGERAKRLTSQLLAFSRKQVIKPKVLDLNILISEHNKMLGRLLGEDIVIETVLTPDLWTVKVDPGQIEQIIINIAVNARDAMPFGGTLTIETANAQFDEEYSRNHAETRPGRYVMLSISDTGVGMDEAIRSHIFEPFFTTKGRDKGTGLGLATVYGIVKQNKGFI